MPSLERQEGADRPAPLVADAEPAWAEPPGRPGLLTAFSGRKIDAGVRDEGTELQRRPLARDMGMPRTLPSPPKFDVDPCPVGSETSELRAERRLAVLAPVRDLADIEARSPTAGPVVDVRRPSRGTGGRSEFGLVAAGLAPRRPGR